MAKSDVPNPIASNLPRTPVRKITRPLVRFLEIESAGGIVLIICTLIALVLANSTFAEAYHKFWHAPFFLQIGNFTLGGEIGHFLVNDVLMTIFFFVVGLEIKRELVSGELREWQKASLPVFAALGGMVVPAGIYMALRTGHPDFRGWGVPMATDIAFVVGVMALLGKRIPFGLKIMLLSLAIADDIGAVVVIAVFYTADLNMTMLGLAGLGLLTTYGLNRLGVRTVPVYIALGTGIWLACYHSGIHPTVAGVILGLLTPASAFVGDATLIEVLQATINRAPGEGPERFEALRTAEFTTREGISPLERLENSLHPWVSFIIMPVFALANAGVHIESRLLLEPVAIAVALGLFLGKPIGVVIFSWLAVKTRIAQLPSGVSWGMLAGGGCLAGIGFTMSLFVAQLAFNSEEYLTASKVGILAGSICSAVLGAAILIAIGGKKRDS